MSAVLQQDPQTDSEGGVEVTRTLSGQAASVQAGLLTPAALAFLAGLHRRFEGERRARLSARAIRQARFDAGALPDFRADTAAIRNGDWRVAPIPAALQDRRVEITGPVDPKMVINALNSGANCYMADFEDSTAPTHPVQVGAPPVCSGQSRSSSSALQPTCPLLLPTLPQVTIAPN